MQLLSVSRGLVPACLFLMMTCLHPVAHADWEYVHWGMTPDEVASAVHETGNPMQPYQRWSGDRRRPSIYEQTTSFRKGDLEFAASFGYSTESPKSLKAVELLLKDKKFCSAWLAELRSLHGRGRDVANATEQNLGVTRLEWINAADHTQVTLMYPPEKYKDTCVTWYVDLRQIVRAAVGNPPTTTETARPSDFQDPEWTLTKTRDSAPSSTQINFYYDKRSLRRSGTATFVRVLVDYAAPQSLSGTAYHSLISQTEIDCPQRRMRVLSSKMTSARMGGGSIVWEGAGPLPWETTSADFSAATGTIVGTERSAIWLSTCLAK